MTTITTKTNKLFHLFTVYVSALRLCHSDVTIVFSWYSYPPK